MFCFSYLCLGFDFVVRFKFCFNVDCLCLFVFV